jgi:Fe-Mn family superoxide dismutase
LNGITPRLIESHYEHNYGGALTRLNAITKELETLDPGTTPADVISRLKRDELTALNSTLLHELYFASLGGDGRTLPEIVASAIARDFGSVDRWRQEYVGLATALAGSAGWVLLTYVPRNGRLINQTGSDHGENIAGGIPILALDMYEHAYHMDMGADAKSYVETFFRNIDWPALERRYHDATHAPKPRGVEQPEFGDIEGVGIEEVRAMMAAGKPVQVIDVRPRMSLSRAHDIAEGVKWRDPEQMPQWIGELSKSEPVVVYCAYGFHVGCNTAIKLREAGFDARYMNSGHSGWRAVGAPLKLATAP